MRLVMVLAFLLAGGPALALSCMRPDVAISYQRAAEADETYVVVEGVVEFDARLLPKRDVANDNRDIEIPAMITGKALTKGGFRAPFSQAITLRSECFGPWCGGAKPGVAYLVFLQRDEAGGYVMRADPCGSWVFAEPSAKQLGRVEACMAGKGCEAAGR